jgi:aarF domain-containing kinase
MLPKVAELIAALPVLDEDEPDQQMYEAINELPPGPTGRPVPMHAARRLWALGGLQAQIALAYLAYWVRLWFIIADPSARQRSEVHLRAGLKMLTTMGYLRGAAMKLGQTLANYPDVFPQEIVETLERLHFDAPPMHFTLLREHFCNDIGKEPEDAFASFETNAFAAASLGQVHRAVLKCGQKVAVKIQYPGIGRSIRADFRSLGVLLLPFHLSKDGRYIQAQFDDLRRVIERETDYEQEAAMLRAGRALFHEDDMIAVPRVFDELSGRRVLTMEYIEGMHIYDFLAANPSQQERDHFGAKIYEATARLYYAGKLLYADPHPGNYLIAPDGRLGFIDFGCVRPYTDDEWALCRRIDEAVLGIRDMTSAARDIAGMNENDDADPAHLKLLSDFFGWMWRPDRTDAPFDFGDADYLQEGVKLFTSMVSKRYVRSAPMSPFTTRWYFGTVAMLYRLRARVNVHAIYNREVVATGWHRHG